MKKTFLAVLAILMCFTVLVNAQGGLNPKKYRSTEDILRQIVDDSTRALRVEVVPTPDRALQSLKKDKNRSNEQILNSLVDPGSNRLKIEFTNFQLFPYDKLVTKWDNATEKVFRFMFKPDGADSNDGLTWATAKKDVNLLLSQLPSDLQGKKIYLLLHPGTYTKVSTSKFNGALYFTWLGTFVNGASTAWATWVKNGATNPIASDDDVEFLTTTTDAALEVSATMPNSLTVDINSVNWGTFLASGCLYYSKIKFTASTAAPNFLVKFNSVHISTESGFCLNLGTTAARGMQISGSTTSYLPFLKIIGGTGDASVGTSTSKAAIGVETSSGNFSISPGWTTGYFASGFGLTNSKNYSVTGIRNLIRDEVNPAAYYKFTSVDYAQGSLPDANLPYIQLVGFKGYCEYTPAMVQLNDASTYPHSVKNATSGAITTYIAEKIIDDGTNIILKTPAILTETTTDPTVVQDTQGAMYVKADKLVLKFNSGGTIKYRVMNLVDTTATWSYTTIAP
ncbi:MAG: hypothetical protein A2440_09865 [Stygiobacter sp. RIFOXYC2_FULL_38_25]|nr:MAG: hypothetical protein A2299_00360 [Stygiobacter sp. RIFOXYB2_FULL_37_11]OGV13505.1 MAG: hypothetical protein A2237_17185 [Stygiobacter sp. RIFOXYA2_FULL_38_8]OGV14797.1 MAG: hypothetical protein A2440_09865 [Stygiobacter sp. RIFOXYC2_FULL_38_25]OGV79290.1 MAG: hypothetical protein A2X65_02235 [Stygiobacter sp. GWF2_38_21]